MGYLKGFSLEGILVDDIPKMDIPPDFNSCGTHARFPPKDAKRLHFQYASFTPLFNWDQIAIEISSMVILSTRS